MFRHGDGGAWRTSVQPRPMAEACNSGEIKPAISFHILRHTWLRDERRAVEVAMNLGHANTRMVENH